jgi:hypothetical protein
MGRGICIAAVSFLHRMNAASGTMRKTCTITHMLPSAVCISRHQNLTQTAKLHLYVCCGHMVSSRRNQPRDCETPCTSSCTTGGTTAVYMHSHYIAPAASSACISYGVPGHQQTLQSYRLVICGSCAQLTSTALSIAPHVTPDVTPCHTPCHTCCMRSSMCDGTNRPEAWSPGVGLWMKIWPEVCSLRPASSCSSVVLPEPAGFKIACYQNSGFQCVRQEWF